jgi:hypothetical protein
MLRPLGKREGNLISARERRSTRLGAGCEAAMAPRTLEIQEGYRSGENAVGMSKLFCMCSNLSAPPFGGQMPAATASSRVRWRWSALS